MTTLYVAVNREKDAQVDGKNFDDVREFIEFAHFDEAHARKTADHLWHDLWLVEDGKFTKLIQEPSSPHPADR
jgi:hypothetical protein